MLSNIINNAIEALHETNNPHINIELDYKKNYLILKIKDNGKGIPDEIQNKIGIRGFSFGKEQFINSGSGLGVFHAKSFIEKNKGEFCIESKINQGTVISMTLIP